MRHRAVVLLAIVISIGLAAQASAVVESYPITFGPDPSLWILESLTGPSSASAGLGVQDTPSGIIDAGSVVAVDGTTFLPPGLDVTHGATRAAGVQTIGSLRVKAAIRSFGKNGDQILRFIYTVTNHDPDTMTVTLDWGGRRANGAHVQIFDTTDHDATFGQNEAWMVTTDDQVLNPRGVTFALGTRGATSATTTQGDAVRTFTTQIGSKRSKTFVFFVALHDVPERAAAIASHFSSRRKLVKARYLSSKMRPANW